MIIHQVYGIYDDGKPMNELFTTGSNLWKEYCEKHGHIYKLWDKKECEELVNTYNNIKSYYYDVKYPIMKCDIIRFLIIYQFGGMYVDLDVQPNNDKINIDENELSLCKYDNLKHKQGSCEYDIEIIYSKKYNISLYNFIAFYVPQQIEEKDKIEIYKTWQVRYVFHTTGPRSFTRYMKFNKIKCNTLSTYQFKEDEKYTIKDDYLKYDFISHHSFSYSPHGKKKSVRYRPRKKKPVESSSESEEEVFNVSIDEEGFYSLI